jgi:hypothetical protein
VRLTTVRSWLFSWLDEWCETKEEFTLSKALFLDSKLMRTISFSTAVVTYSILTLTPIVCTKELTAGSNITLCQFACPTHSLVESTRILTHQSKLKCGDTKGICTPRSYC